MEKSKSKKGEALEELKPIERVHVVKGYTWLEYISILYGHELFKFKDKEVFKFELFWAGVNPFDVLDCKKGFYCQKVPNKYR